MIKVNSGLGKMVITAALAVLFFTAFTAVASAADQLYVNETHWWRTGGAFNASDTPIQFAIDNATAGDSIYVYNGSYAENVDVGTAHLTIEGEGRDVVTVTVVLNYDHVFEVTEDYVNISGFNVTGATNTNSKAGIYLGNNVAHCNISDNTATNNYNGISLYGLCTYNTLMNNTANSNNNYGILVYGSSNNTLTNNTANSNTLHGIHLQLSSNNNTLTSNTANSNNNRGIVLYQSSNNTLTNNTANSNSWHGILLNDADNNNITCNWVAHNDQRGFYLTQGSKHGQQHQLQQHHSQRRATKWWRYLPLAVLQQPGCQRQSEEQLLGLWSEHQRNQREHLRLAGQSRQRERDVPSEVERTGPLRTDSGTGNDNTAFDWLAGTRGICLVEKEGIGNNK